LCCILITGTTAASWHVVYNLSSSDNQEAVAFLNGGTGTHTAMDAHIASTANPHAVTAAQAAAIPNDGWIAITATGTSGTLDAPSFEISFNADMTAIIGLGDRIKITQATTKYFIVTKVGAFSAGATIITCYGGTDYALVATATTAITAPFVSRVKTPFGFPAGIEKWTTTYTDSTNRTQASPVNGTVYNLGSLSNAFPIGAWKVNVSVMVDAVSGAGAGSATHKFSLSTANNSFSDTTNAIEVGSYAKAQADNLMETFQTGSLDYALSLTTKTTYYSVSKTLDNNMYAINLYNNAIQPFVIRLICAYI
jgi:hypothetical protein